MRIRHDRGQGRAVVLVHAALLDASSWNEVVAPAPPGVRVISVDLPDMGFDAPGMTLPEMERSFQAWLAETPLEKPVTLVGHSLGAWLVARTLSRAPALSDRALLIGGVARLPAEMASGYVQAADALSSGTLARAAFTSSILEAALAGSGDPALADRLTSMLASYPHDRIVRALRLVASVGEPENAVGPYAVPTKLVHGGADGSAPVALARELAALGDRAELEVWPGAGHMLPMTHPQRIARLAFD